ncbi:MAG TPA: hypothetical protein VME92_17725 [Acetobacteraceae bacterium]|nr:hypothetical protein [Acetobacteraceae bacterium]
MNLVDLIVVICSLLNPTQCQEKHLLFQSQGSLRSCMIEAEPYLAQYMGEHPGYRVQRFRCAWPDTEDQPS